MRAEALTVQLLLYHNHLCGLVDVNGVPVSILYGEIPIASLQSLQALNQFTDLHRYLVTKVMTTVSPRSAAFSFGT